MRKRRNLFVYLTIIFAVYLLFNTYQIKQTENFNRKTKLLNQNAKSYNPVCEIPELQIINHENSLPGNYFLFFMC